MPGIDEFILSHDAFSPGFKSSFLIASPVAACEAEERFCLPMQQCGHIGALQLAISFGRMPIWASF